MRRLYSSEYALAINGSSPFVYFCSVEEDSGIDPEAVASGFVGVHVDTGGFQTLILGGGPEGPGPIDGAPATEEGGIPRFMGMRVGGGAMRAAKGSYASPLPVEPDGCWPIGGVLDPGPLT